MFSLDQYYQLYDQLLLLFQNPYLKRLSFYNDFKNDWTKVLKDNLYNPVLSSTNTPDGQIYEKSIVLDSGFSFELHYEMPLIQTFYKNEKRDGTQTFLIPCSLDYDQKEGLKYNNFDCSYNYYPQMNENLHCSKIETPPFISHLPLIPKQFVVVDGNHRISKAIDNKADKISAYLLRPENTPCFLMSSAEMVAFLFLMDICTILEGNVRDIQSNLAIYRKPSLLDVLRHRGRMV